MTPYRFGALGFALLATVLDFLNQVEVDVLVLVGVAIVLALLDVATSYAGAINITLEQQQSGVEIRDKLLDLKRRTGGRGLGLD